MTGINYPVERKQIPLFKKHNPSISINVLSFESETEGFTVEYLSPERGRQHNINLLLLDDPTDTTKHRYVHVNNISRLVAHRSKHHSAAHVCHSWLHPFYTSATLEDHIPFCSEHHPQQFQYPDPTIANLESPTLKSSTRSVSFS